MNYSPFQNFEFHDSSLDNFEKLDSEEEPIDFPSCHEAYNGLDDFVHIEDMIGI
jgi:hypothetical protein